ncbi:tetraspanin-8-like isoform X2 [Perca fluviatilis]|uniref:tetraspanin-8-like isoform X2 n=1 Tax=Perca fluviatilis TaxID=8168 RepID=UPI001962F0EC|nr:tetraspanin-8-like isoform X2 [Perca fluviatilis]
MPQVNSCLKWLLTIFNILFAIVGIVIITLGLTSQFNYVNGVMNLDLKQSHFYIVGSIVMVIAILGAVGAYNESKACLVLFLVCMILGSIAMLLPGTLMAVFRSEAASMQDNPYDGHLPMDQASPIKRQDVEEMQMEMQCCGLFSYEDWKGNIPDSCLCSKLDEMEGKCQTVDYGKSVYSKACFPIIFSGIMQLYDSVMASFLTLAVLGLLGMVLSSVMIHQLRSPNRPVFLMTAPPFTKSPQYEELHNVLPPKYY